MCRLFYFVREQTPDYFFFLVPRQVVHFGGYLLGKAHSQRVRVVNVSRTSQRLHILGPSTDCFKVRVTEGDKNIVPV